MTSHRSLTAACPARAAVTGTGLAVGSQAAMAAIEEKTGSARVPSGATRVTAAMSVCFSTACSPTVVDGDRLGDDRHQQSGRGDRGHQRHLVVRVGERGGQPGVGLTGVTVEARTAELPSAERDSRGVRGRGPDGVRVGVGVVGAHGRPATSSASGSVKAPR